MCVCVIVGLYVCVCVCVCVFVCACVFVCVLFKMTSILPILTPF